MNASDHYLPQTYMRGFQSSGDSNYGKNLSVYVLSRRRWERKSPVQICKFRGFYDHSNPVIAKQVKDQLWTVENGWPALVNDLRTPTVLRWKRAVGRLLGFVAVQAVRNPSFRRGILGRQDLVPAGTGLHDPRPQDRALEEMLAALPELITWLHHLDWALRWTDIRNPFITSDQCVVMEGSAPTRDQAVVDPNTLLFFPVTATLLAVGATSRFDLHATGMLLPDIKHFYRLVFRSAMEYVLGPHPVEVAAEA